MGLYCLDSNPSKYLWDDASGSADSYNSFASGFPLVDIGKCVYYSAQGALAGKWLSGDCEKETRAYVCELPHTYADSCQFNYNGHCYTIHNPTTFVQAQFICEQECGNLASITSANENRYLQTLTNNLVMDSYLIGGMWPSINVFNWIDGSATNYNNIDRYASYNANCMAVSNSASLSVPPGYWYSTSCTTTHTFICKRPAGVKCSGTPPPVTITPVPSNPSFCNSTLLLAPGVITTPNFPQNYANNQFCSYQLNTLGSYNILLHFTSFPD
ncbi:hypothetical protein GCK72_007166 [Caenorhabditis remanei]|uniref:C-type LECtin n=1 Tax=Caenorhabditis remanei TaxID=31234 RepID=A0A6A5HKY5_CAERE|nr:hypothetical protein GCK72_007166 [Caenorhabditis remanei]KAF1767207.1 hypothetical protein GCK72_007166 [Caenorhabditis remanei]